MTPRTTDPAGPQYSEATLENIRLSAATVADPALVVATALLSEAASSIDEALDHLLANRDAIKTAAAQGVAETSASERRSSRTSKPRARAQRRTRDHSASSGSAQPVARRHTSPKTPTASSARSSTR